MSYSKKAALARTALEKVMAISKLGRLALVSAMSVLVLGQWFVPARDQIVAKKAVQPDRYGDPLPDGAVARLGTTRWRHRAQVIAFSSDANYFAAGWGMPHLYDAQSGQFLRSIDTRAEGLHFSSDGKELMTLKISPKPPFVRFVHVWDVNTGKERRQFAIKGARFTWSGKFLITIIDEARIGISIWDLESGKEHANVKIPVQDLFFATALAPNGKTLALRYRTKLYLLDALNGKELHSLPMSIERSGVVFTPDSKTLVFMDNGRVCVWDVATGDIVRRLEIPKDRIGILAISNDGRHLAAASGGVYLWDLAKGKLLHSKQSVNRRSRRKASAEKWR